ncbi:alpha/beta-hydrolase [Neocallimastix lanati (nom. inval.)]|jgi:polyhydroxybutyrate depolymerase|uniref:feruloyl esterase n=1 Tax=Neocallimastix californiae TaxID=1754190 RepID=A0A1Y2DFJ0_9FUNG|nr:alpha/beta-hydrolase [Neocallimastix sp. JGI-2020a]ORY57957.1 alpha/beta-hydrolase [Neocallimastix californiae]|eukprot:ORY57957.1 alpha/beta-hydrolase [Neocallimastix californiae]
MKNITLLPLIATVFAGKALADCFSTKLGYPCCTSTSDVVYTDDDGDWGIENNNWCGIETCWSLKLGYPCCQNTNVVYYTDDDGDWSVENNDWCGIVKGKQQPTPPKTTQKQPQTTQKVQPTQAQVVDCSGKTLKSNTNLSIGGRKVIVKFPNGYRGDKPTPLLINYHPIMGSASQWEGGSQTAKAALNDGAIVAFMDGAQGPMGQAWNVGPCCTDADDVKFTRDFIKEITNKACVDPKRIYAAGFSMGGGMSNYAGCYLSDVIAAAAPSAFDLAKEIVDAGKCKPSRPFPILNFRGTSDQIVMYNGGLSQVVPGKPITFMGAKNNLKEWAKMNGCSGSPKQNTPGNNCEMYENCNGGVKVGLCTINGGGHNEGDGKMGWDFVKQFSLP